MSCVDGRHNQLVDASISGAHFKIAVAARQHSVDGCSQARTVSETPGLLWIGVFQGEGPKTDSCPTHGTKASSPYEPLLRGTCEPSEVLCGRW